MPDGSVIFDTKLDESGLKSGLSKLGKTVVAGLAAATAAVGAFAKSAVEVGMSFDAAMSKVSAVSGAVGDDLAALRDKALEMGDKTQFSATEAAEAFNYMAMAGWKTKDMLSGIEGIMNLAAASGEDLATTSDIVTDALTAFGMTAADSTHFADILAVAASNANTDVGMMGDTFKYVAPVCGTLGYTAEDAALAIGLMANSSIKGSMAGTALRAIIARLSTDAGASKKSLGALGTLTEKLGVEFYNADGSARELSDVLLEARDAWKELSDEQKINYANTIAGQEGLSAWNAMMNASDADVRKLTSSLEDADGAAEQMAATMIDNLAGDITLFKSAVQTAQIAISDELTPTLREFVQFGKDSVSELTAAFKEGGLTGAVEALQPILSELLAKVMGILPAMIEAGAGMLMALVQGIIENLPLVTQGAAQILVSLIEGLSESLPQLLSKMPEIIMAMLAALQEQLPLIAEAGVSLLQNLADGFASNIPSLLGQILPMVLSFTEVLRENFGNIVDSGIDLIMSLVDGLIEGLPTLIEYIPTIITNICGLINDNMPKILMAGVQIIGKLVLGLIQSIPTIVANIPKIIQAIVSVIMANDWLNLGKKIIEFFTNGIKSMVSHVGAGIKTIADKIKSGITALPKQALQWGKDLLQNFINGITAKISGLISKVKSIGSTIKSFLGFSVPEKGPLHDFDTYAPDMMDLYAAGMAANRGKVLREAEGLAEDLADIDYSIPAKVDFDAPDVDYDALIESARRAVEGESGEMGTAVSAGRAAELYSAADRDKDKAEKENAPTKPTAVVTTVEIDGREFARQTAPYMEKELDWRGK